MSKVLKEKIVGLESLAPAIYKMTIQSEYIAQQSLPGQFINVKCSEGIQALLRRPISICSVDREAQTFDIVFQVKGIGTEYLSQKQTGSELDFIGPLGTPFELPEGAEKIAVLGGGIGVFPLLNLLEYNRNLHKTAFLGFRSKEFIVLEHKFQKVSNGLYISTDDGSAGYKGLITDLLEEQLLKQNFDVIYTCGPTPMIRRVVDIANRNGIRCQVSLEQRMGCGIGACLVCACKTRLGDEWEYSHVCKDGPVFWSEHVILE